MLTPLEISHKEFTKQLRGYTPKEVDEFLERVAGYVEDVLKEKSALVGEIETLKETLARYHTIEETLQNTLVLAQKTAEETILNARKQGQLIEEDARRRGMVIESEEKQKLSRLNDEFDQVRGHQRSFVRQFRALLENFLGEIERFGKEDAAEAEDGKA